MGVLAYETCRGLEQPMDTCPKGRPVEGNFPQVKHTALRVPSRILHPLCCTRMCRFIWRSCLLNEEDMQAETCIFPALLMQTASGRSSVQIRRLQYLTEDKSCIAQGRGKET